MLFLSFSLVQAIVEAISIQRNEEEVNTAYSGDNIRVKLKGVEEEVCVCVCVCVCVSIYLGV